MLTPQQPLIINFFHPSTNPSIILLFDAQNYSHIILPQQQYKIQNWRQILLEIIISKQHSTMTTNFTRKKIENYSYGLTDVIGKGYSSQVYIGRNDQTSQKVAVKVIELKMLKNQINKILLQSEILILKELKQEQSILTLHEVFSTKNNTYIITELCQTDLSKLIKKGLEEQEAISFMEQIIKGYLNFAKKDIIHRDLKPANILVTEEKQLKIADFGFAIKVVDAAKSNKYNVGSPLYMAPESLKRNQYSIKTDIWALGIIFYQLLTGQTPWKAQNEKQLIRKIESQDSQKIIEKMNIKNSSKLFLKKTLKMDKSARMTLEDLENFLFRPQSEKILAEKTINISLKCHLKPTEMSLHSMSPRKDGVFENKLADRTIDQKLSKDFSSKNLSAFHHQSFNQSFKNTATEKFFPNPQKQQKKQNPQIQNQQNYTFRDEKKCDKKKTSKILISQIHFCRFLYKLLGRILQSQKAGILKNAGVEVKALMSDYVGIIKHKIQNILMFRSKNFLNIAGYEQYKLTSDYSKIIKIAQEYKERYSSQLKNSWNHCRCTFLTANTFLLIQLMSSVLESSQSDQNFIQNYSKDIVILDYLITAKQLIEISQKGQNYERFAQKSRIEEIVEGKTAQIHWELYRRIVHRSNQIKEKEAAKQGEI